MHLADKTGYTHIQLLYILHKDESTVKARVAQESLVKSLKQEKKSFVHIITSGRCISYFVEF